LVDGLAASQQFHGGWVLVISQGSVMVVLLVDLRGEMVLHRLDSKRVAKETAVALVLLLKAGQEMPA
jgi:hypothetical protein